MYEIIRALNKRNNIKNRIDINVVMKGGSKTPRKVIIELGWSLSRAPQYPYCVVLTLDYMSLGSLP